MQQPIRRVVFTCLALLTGVLTGCPQTMEAVRDGGTACTSVAQCNPPGMTCGSIHLCVQGFCTDSTTVLACREGGYPDSGPSGNCATYEDCNPAPACGSVIPCINFLCDPTAPPLSIPCADGGPSDAAFDATFDATTDAADASPAVDASVGDASE
jgi:hypothetical protein